MAERHPSTARKTDRLEAFSDAVLAIAITVPVVRLTSPQVPASGDLGQAYAALWPDYIAYGFSVAVIGLYWAHSHFSGKIIEKTDHVFNLLTILFLAAVSITPFPARAFVEHMAGDANSRTAGVIYTSLLAIPSLVWLIRWSYAVGRGLPDPRLDPTYLRQVTIKYAVTAAVFVAGVALSALVDWRVGFGVTALVTLTYLIPPMRPRYKPGQDPADELEEADGD